MRRGQRWSTVLVCAAFIGAGFSSACSSKPKDADLVTSIQSQMFGDAQLKGASLQVASFGGQVTLKGTVPNDAARYEAYKIVTQTPGVTKVNDQMVVESDGSEAAAQPVDAANAVPPPAPAKANNQMPATHVKPQAVQNAGSQQNDSEIAGNDVADATAPQPAEQAPQSATSTNTLTSTNTPPPPPAEAPAPISASAPAPPPPPEPQQVEIAAGTTVSVRMIDSINSSVNQAGEVFHATLDAPLIVNSEVAVPKGADVYVRLESASSAGKASGQSELRIELVKLEFQGQSYPLVSSTYSQAGESRGKDTAKKVGGGAVLGAIIGAMAGGGKGAAIGAAAGAGAGGVYEGATRGQQVKIPSETKLNFQLDQPVTVTVQPQQNS